MFITENLFETIIEKNIEKTSKLKIITGYSSANFVESIINHSPSVSIDLFIGMSQQGISKENHAKYLLISERFHNVNIFYQIKGNMTHIKLLDFKCQNTNKVYIGSANFSENGFTNQRELMVEVTNDTTDLFNEQVALSLLCTEKNIEKYISFFDDENNILKEYKYSENVKNNSSYKTGITTNLDNVKADLLKMRKQANPKYYRKLEVELVLDELRWEKTGINAKFDEKEPYLRTPNSQKFKQFFPEGNDIIIFAEDGNKYKGKLRGNFNREFVLIDISIYDYICNITNARSDEPISRNDLNDHGSTKITFERIDEFKFLMYLKRIDSNDN